MGLPGMLERRGKKQNRSLWSGADHEQIAEKGRKYDQCFSPTKIPKSDSWGRSSFGFSFIHLLRSHLLRDWHSPRHSSYVTPEGWHPYYQPSTWLPPLFFNGNQGGHWTKAETQKSAKPKSRTRWKPYCTLTILKKDFFLFFSYNNCIIIRSQK